MNKRTIPDVPTFLEQIHRRGAHCVFEGEIWRQVDKSPHNEAHELVRLHVSAIVLFGAEEESGFLMECVQFCGNDYAGEDPHGSRQADHWCQMIDRLAEEMGLTVWEGRIEGT